MSARTAATVSDRAHRSFKTLADPSTVGREEEAAAALRRTGAVEFAEPDYAMPAALLPNDPEFSEQWFHSHIHTPEAWSITQGSTNVIVAVCDTGIDATHPDLAGQLMTGYNVVDNNTDTTPVAGHGTEVAGVLAGIGNNGIGVAGAAWRARILPVRITDNPDTTAWCSDMADGVEWAAEQGAKVINLSYYTAGCPEVIDDAAQYARADGALVFVAAGNDGEDLSDVYPSTHTFMLLAATDQSDGPAPFTNIGAPIDLSAPGEGIETTNSGGGYGFASGTSFASPLAAGVAALIFSIGPAFSPDQVRNFLTSTAQPISASGMGAGLLNALGAVNAAQSVIDGNQPPALSLTGDASIVWPSSAALSAVVSDDGLPTHPGRITVSWRKLQGPGNIRFTTSGNNAVAWFSAPGNYVVSAAASDGALTTLAEVSVAVNQGASAAVGDPLAVTAVDSGLNGVRVYPNPWRSDRRAWSNLQFDHVGNASTVKLFTIAGHFIRTLISSGDRASWDLKNASGDLVGSGIYLYLVTDSQGRQSRGKLAVIR